MTVKRQWYFTFGDSSSTRRDHHPYVVTCSVNGDIRPLKHKSRSADGRKFGAVKGIELASKGDYIKLVFVDEKADPPHALLAETFRWNANDFCLHFKGITDSPSAFIKKFEELMLLEDSDISMASVNIEASIATSTSSSKDNRESSVNASTCSLSEDEPDLAQELSSASAKRKRLPDIYKKRIQAEVKRPKVGATDKTEEEIFKEKVCKGYCGHFKLHVRNLGTGKQLREIDRTFLANLTQKMREYSDESYNALCVVVNVDKCDFDEKNMSGYKYEVIGGQHHFLAAKELSESGRSNADFFKTRYCVVYASLSDEETMWLASNHNQNGEYRHPMIFQEKVKFCREFAKTIMTPSKDKEKQLRSSCKLILKEKDDSIIREACKLAMLDDQVYDSVSKIITLFEDGQLRNQKLGLKDLQSKPEIGKTFFRSIGNLHSSTATEILQQLIEKEITKEQFSKELIILVKLTTIQQNFAYLMTGGDWDLAKEKYPKHTTRECLQRYSHMSFKSIPESFRKFCEYLKSSQRDVGDTDTVTGVEDAKSVTLNADVLKVDFEMIDAECKKSQLGSFRGFQLIILDMPDEWTSEQIKQFTIRFHSINMKKKKVPTATLR